MQLFSPEQEGDNEHHLSGVVLQGLSAFQAKTVSLFAPTDTGSLSLASSCPPACFATALCVDKAEISGDNWLEVAAFVCTFVRLWVNQHTFWQRDILAMWSLLISNLINISFYIAPLSLVADPVVHQYWGESVETRKCISVIYYKAMWWAVHRGRCGEGRGLLLITVIVAPRLNSSRPQRSAAESSITVIN